MPKKNLAQQTMRHGSDTAGREALSGGVSTTPSDKLALEVLAPEGPLDDAVDHHRNQQDREAAQDAWAFGREL